MKTLKKTLCLVLALVMALSLMSVASAAYESNFEGYTDVETVGAAYAEAVDVLMGLGIVNGMSATEIGPEGYYTRAQAAKIATYLAVGPTVAEMLPTAESFSDVPTTHWASKYIAYCAGKNILNAVTATEYQPEAYVTGYQFAKMVLAAAGYGAKDEFVGNGWSIATAQLALDKDIDLFAGDAKAATNDPITRQQAMLIAFNALDLKSVTLGTNGAYNEGTADFYGADIDTEDATVNGLDGYYYVDAEDNQISDFYATDVLVGTYTNGTKMADIAKALGIKETTSTDITITENGDTANAYAAKLALASTDALKGGQSLNVYLTKDKDYKFFYTVETIVEAELGAEVTNEESDNYGKFAWVFAGETFYAAKDAYVDGGLYIATYAYGLDTAISEAETVEGTITASATAYLKLDAEKYTKALTYAAEAGLGVADEAVLYLATDGTVLYAAAPADAPVDTTETLVYAIAYYEKFTAAVAAEKDAYGNVVPNTGSAAKYDLYIQGVNMAGEEVSYLVASNAASVLEETEYADFVPAMKAVTYTASTKLYSLSAPTTAALIDVDEDAISVNKYYYNNAEFVSIIGALKDLTVSDGTLKAADAAGDVWAVFTTDATTGNKTVSAIFYWAEAETPADTTYSYSVFVPADIEAYIEETSVLYEDATVPTTVYTVEAYIAGVKTELLVEDYEISEGFYKYAVDECGVYELVKLTEGYVADFVDNMYGNYMTVDTFVDFDITGVKVVDLTEDGDGKIAAEEAVAFYYSVSGTTKTIECIYIFEPALS